MPKSVLLLHGWLGHPSSLGELGDVLAAAGHRILPHFRQYDSWPRRKTLEDLADEMERAFREAGFPEKLEAPLVIVAHSMGGLLARTWMLRHYATKGVKAPVERLIEAGSPRHGVLLRTVGRTVVGLGLMPGTAMGWQMAAPGPFTWELAWAELEHEALLPPVLALAGVMERKTILAAAAGGAESDEIVPAVFCDPNPVFLVPGAVPRARAAMSFLPFRGHAHNFARGILAHIKAGQPSPVAEAVCHAVDGNLQHSAPAGLLAPIRRRLLLVRRKGAGRLRLEREAAAEKPQATHRSDLALFGWTQDQNTVPRLTLRDREERFEIPGEAAAKARVVYLDWPADSQ